MSKKVQKCTKSREKSPNLISNTIRISTRTTIGGVGKFLSTHDVAGVVGQFERADMLMLDEGRGSLAPHE